MDITQVAKEIRAILKKEFPAVKFSVKCSRFSQGSSVDICWTDGPTTKCVDEAVETYGTSLKFIMTTRLHSNQFVNKAIETWKSMHPRYAHFTLTCNGDVDCRAEFNIVEFNNNPNLRLFESSVYELIRHSVLSCGKFCTQQLIPVNKELEALSAPEPKLVEVVTEATSHLHPQSERQPQSNQLGQTELNALEVDRQQVYAQYLASQQEGDELEAKLAVKKTEAQVYFAMMKEIEEKIEAKKREAEVITPQAQHDFDVRTLESKKVTLILINTMGFPVCRHITVIAADIVSAKRYYGEMTDKKCLELQYVEKGKRKPKGTRYIEANLAVALGWQNIEIPTNSGYIDAFDNGLLDAMIRQAKDVVYTQKGL